MWTSLALGDNAPVRITSVKVGLDNNVKVGVPTVVRIGLEAAADFDGELSIVTPEPRGFPVRITDQVHLKAGTPFEQDFTLPIGRLESTLTVEVRRGEQIVVRRKLVCGENSDEADIKVSRHQRPFWLIVGSLRWGVAAANATSTTGTRPDAATTRTSLLLRVLRSELATAEEFPSHPAALDPYDTLVLAGEFGLSDAAALQLERWVKNGGHLVAIVGSRTTQLRSSPLNRWLPGKDRLMKAVKLTDLAPLVSYSQTDFPMPPANRVDGTLFESSDGDTVVRTFDGTLAIRFVHGFGKVTLVGIDVDKRPISNWRGLEGFVATLGGLQSTGSKNDRADERLSRTGITDLQTQLAAALGQFDGTTEQSVPSMLSLVLVFLLLIGPVDYLVMHRWLKRPHWTWVSFPGVVLLAVLFATMTANASRGKSIAANQLDLLDYDVSTGHFRQTTFAAIYSPDNRRAQVSLEHDARSQLLRTRSVSKGLHNDSPLHSKEPLTMSWLASPESNFGGMYRIAGFEVGKAEYEWNRARTVMANAPISLGSTRSIQGTLEAQIAKPLIEANLKQAGVGQFTEDSYLVHHFAGSMDQWMLAFAGRVYFHSVEKSGVHATSAIEPGKRLVLSPTNLRSTELKSFLTGSSYRPRERKSAIDPDHFHAIDAYDPTNTHWLSIVRMMSLHRIAGGTDYTGLTNDPLQKWELSDVTQLDRAVLIGELKLPASRLLIDGQEAPSVRQTVLLRCVLPVEKSQRAENALPKFEDPKQTAPAETKEVDQ